MIVEARWSFFSSRYLFSVEAFLWPLKDSQTRGNPSAAASAVGRLWVGPVGPGGGYPRRLRSCSAGSLLGQSWLCASHGAAPWTNPAQPAFPRLVRGAVRLHPPFPGLGRASPSQGRASLRLASPELAVAGRAPGPGFTHLCFPGRGRISVASPGPRPGFKSLCSTRRARAWRGQASLAGGRQRPGRAESGREALAAARTRRGVCTWSRSRPGRT